MLSVGIVLGVFPMAGIPTVLCLVAAFVLRLNVAALQLLNSVASPLQLVLLFPLSRIGSYLFGGLSQPKASLAGGFGAALLHAIAGWTLICIPLGVILYCALLLFMRRRRAVTTA